MCGSRGVGPPGIPCGGCPTSAPDWPARQCPLHIVCVPSGLRPASAGQLVGRRTAHGYRQQHPTQAEPLAATPCPSVPTMCVRRCSPAAPQHGARKWRRTSAALRAVQRTCMLSNGSATTRIVRDVNAMLTNAAATSAGASVRVGMICAGHSYPDAVRACVMRGSASQSHSARSGGAPGVMRSC